MQPHFAPPPIMKLDTGWKILCTGIPCYQIETKDQTAQAAPIRPFCYFKNEMLPKHIQRDFNLHWRPIFELMEACPGLNPEDPDSFDRGMEYLNTRVQYVFQKRKANPMQEWELSTWSNHVHHSCIANHGTESNKAAAGTNSLQQGTTQYNTGKLK
jgi:hypothetical protein